MKNNNMWIWVTVVAALVAIVVYLIKKADSKVDAEYALKKKTA